MLKLSLATILLFASINFVSASQPTPYNLEGIIDNSLDIFVGKILSAKVADKRHQQCDQGQIYYQGTVVEVFKGNRKELDFCTQQKFLANGEYLIFFDKKLERNKLWLAVLISHSFLDPTIKWLEIDSLTMITTSKLEIVSERTLDCRHWSEPTNCNNVVKARELLRLEDVIDEIRTRND